MWRLTEKARRGVPLFFTLDRERPSYNLHEKSGSKSISVVTAACFVGRLPGPVCHAALFEGQIGK